jgi:hypothetical protein
MTFLIGKQASGWHGDWWRDLDADVDHLRGTRTGRQRGLRQSGPRLRAGGWRKLKARESS